MATNFSLLQNTDSRNGGAQSPALYTLEELQHYCQTYYKMGYVAGQAHLDNRALVAVSRWLVDVVQGTGYVLGLLWKEATGGYER